MLLPLSKTPCIIKLVVAPNDSQLSSTEQQWARVSTTIATGIRQPWYDVKFLLYPSRTMPCPARLVWSESSVLATEILLEDGRARSDQGHFVCPLLSPAQNPHEQELHSI